MRLGGVIKTTKKTKKKITHTKKNAWIYLTLVLPFFYKFTGRRIFPSPSMFKFQFELTWKIFRISNDSTALTL